MGFSDGVWDALSGVDLAGLEMLCLPMDLALALAQLSAQLLDTGLQGKSG